MQVEVALLVFNVLLLGLILYGLLRPQAARRTVKDLIKHPGERLKTRRRLRAKSPTACDLCCAEGHTRLTRRAEPVPYGQRKSRRGRKKTISSEGYACL